MLQPRAALPPGLKALKGQLGHKDLRDLRGMLGLQDHRVTPDHRVRKEYKEI